MSPDRTVARRGKSELRYTILGALLALSAILLLQSGHLIWRSYHEYREGQHILAANYDNDRLLRAAANLLNERAAATMLLNAPEPVGKDDHHFIELKRKTAKLALDRVLGASLKPDPVIPPQMVDDYRRDYERVGALRQRIDKALKLPHHARDDGLAAEWFDAQSALLEDIKTIYILKSKQVMTGSYDLATFENVKLAALELRYAAGAEVTTLSAGIFKPNPFAHERVHRMNRLVVRSAQAYDILKARAALIGRPQVDAALKQIQELYFERYGFLRDVELGLTSGDGMRWGVNSREVDAVLLAAVASIDDLLTVTAQLAEQHATGMAAKAWKELIAYSVVLAFLLLTIAGSAMLLSVRVLKPLQRLQMMVDSASEAIITVDAEGRIETVNPGALHLFGYREDEMVGCSVLLLAADPDQPGDGRLAGRFADVAARMPGTGLALCAHRKNGERFDIHLSLSELWDDGNQKFSAIIRDITEVRTAERKIQEAERKLRDVTDRFPGCVYQVRTGADGTRAFEFVSGGVQSLLGIDAETVLQSHRSVWSLVHEDDRRSIVSAEKSALSSHEPLISLNFRIRHPDGGIKWLATKASLRYDADGGMLWTGYWVDVSERKALETALHEAKVIADGASQAKSAFLATMSHEIRTPMNGVLGMLELLGLTKLDAEQRSTLEAVDQSGRELLRILDDILDFSKIEAGKLEIRPEIASIEDDVIESIYRTHAGNAVSKGLQFTRSIDPRISPALWVDHLRLRQILHNFLSNALKFTPRGRVDLRAELVERGAGFETLRFSVTDTGIGISPENQGKLFHPFVQAEADTTRRFGGTGLGLTICKGLAESMGGRIEMISALGQGTAMVLTLELPVASASDMARTLQEKVLTVDTVRLRRPPPTLQQAERERMLVLAVDDHSTNRNVIMRQLNTLGYAAETAKNGVEALEKWKSGRFALIITDCEMPEMDGYSLARQVRRDELEAGAARTPIIACTANAFASEAAQCFAAGMDDYLAKPTAILDLGKVLDKWLPLAAPESPPREMQPRAIPDGAPSAAMRDGAPIDRTQLAEISGGDAIAEREILIDFRGVNDNDVAILGQALKKRDIVQVMRISHGIKGASKTIGAKGLASASERLEHAGRANDWLLVDANTEAFYRELENLNKYLSTL